MKVILINLLKIKKYILIFLFYNILLIYNLFINFPIFIFFIFYWFFKIVFFKFNNKKKELQPKKLNINGNYFLQYIFVKSIVQPYLRSFMVIYTITKFIYKKTDKIVINLNNILNLMKFFFFKIITGISLNLIKQASFISNKLLSILKFRSSNYINLFFFNLTIEELNSLKQLELLKIYKNLDNKFNFNPKKEKIIFLFKTLFPKVELIFPETKNEQKIADIISSGLEEVKDESVKGYMEIGKSKQHYTVAYNIAKPGIGIDTIATNYTSKPTFLGIDNISLKEKSFITKSYVISSKDVMMETTKNFTDLKDSRIASEIFHLQDVALLASLGLEEPNRLAYSSEYNRLSLFMGEKSSNKIRGKTLKTVVEKYGGEPTNSPIYEIDFKLREIHSQLTDAPQVTQENVFKYAIATLLSKPENFDKLEEIAKQYNKT